MARIDLKQGEQKRHVARALKELRAGYVIVAPLESGYVYLADAFTPFAVRAMHVLRGDELGVTSQILAHSAETVEGIAREIPLEARDLMSKFWPGFLSISLRPHMGLNWDLGDEKELDSFNVRVPKSKFVRAVLRESGPLAVASASPAGQPPMLKIERASVTGWGVAAIFDNGAIRVDKRSTIIEADEDGIRLVREGAISLREMAEVAPSISAL